MSVNTFKYIHFAHYKDIPNWSVQYVIFDLKPGFLQTFNNAKRFQFIITEITDISLTFQIGKKPSFKIVLDLKLVYLQEILYKEG